MRADFQVDAGVHQRTVTEIRILFCLRTDVELSPSIYQPNPNHEVCIHDADILWTDSLISIIIPQGIAA